jgi:diaminopimelate decarboxylase
MSVRARCHGIAPLTARLEPWQTALCETPAVLAELLEQHGSPVNVIDPGPMAANAGALQAAAAEAGVDLRVFFARKANKALALVDAARGLGLGVDVASERELRQVLDRGVAAGDIIVTAAVKPRALLELCVAARVTVAVDNLDELALLHHVAAAADGPVPVAIRLAPVLDRPPTRFGLPAAEALAIAGAWPDRLAIAGVHFHLDGYAAGDRVAALEQSVALVDGLRARGHDPAFVDIGGGIPMSYLDDGAEWDAFWRDPQTYDDHRLGTVYPYHQAPVRGAWLSEVLACSHVLRSRRLELRCEPGRSLLDGCGLTAARVEFRKQRADGTWLIGVAMNRTQCRSTSDDFLVDPLLLRTDDRAGEPIEGFLVGAYCIERELLTWRRLRFPDGVCVGDIVVFPNTAGYLMHILESASHQIPLARNVVLGPDGPRLDPIDVSAVAR